MAVVPWLAYALPMWSLNRDDRSDGDVTVGIDHSSVQGALALVLALLPLSAALRGDLHPFVVVCSGVAASYLGLVSLAWPDAAGAFGQAWSIAAIAWGPRACSSRRSPIGDCSRLDPGYHRRPARRG